MCLNNGDAVHRTYEDFRRSLEDEIWIWMERRLENRYDITIVEEFLGAFLNFKVYSSFEQCTSFDEIKCEVKNCLIQEFEKENFKKKHWIPNSRRKENDESETFPKQWGEVQFRNENILTKYRPWWGFKN